MIDETSPLLLGSASPRRREILTTLGVPFRAVSLDVDETIHDKETPDAYLVRIVLDKLRHAAEHVAGCAAVLVADTTVVLDGRVLGKPAGVDDARRMIAALSGRPHFVCTRFAIARGDEPTKVLDAMTVRTRVMFRPLDEDEIIAYAETGEGLDKAGGYAIQGIGAFAVSTIEGSYSNVVGLPACEVIKSLRLARLLGPFPRARTT